MRSGATEPIYERYVLKTLGILRVHPEQKKHA
jgi:hypothetical protein